MYFVFNTKVKNSGNKCEPMFLQQESAEGVVEHVTLPLHNEAVLYFLQICRIFQKKKKNSGVGKDTFKKKILLLLVTKDHLG